MTDETVPDRLERTIDRFGMALEAGLAPARRAVFALHSHEQPAGRHIKGFDPADLHAAALPSLRAPKGRGNPDAWLDRHGTTRLAMTLGRSNFRIIPSWPQLG